MDFIEIDRARYEDLIAKEERLNIVENAICNMTFYNGEFELFKTCFGYKNEMV